MKCPYCSIAFHRSDDLAHQNADVVSGWSIVTNICPSCKKLILHLRSHPLMAVHNGPSRANILKITSEVLVKPSSGIRPLPQEVPEKYAKDFREAVAVLGESPRASAALSRFCLQKLLRDEANVKIGDLNDEIQQVIDSKKLPTTIAGAIDAIRNIGNFATHPNKSKVSGEITEVEPHEAEWTLDVLESLFDLYLVQPIRLAKKRDLLNQKLNDTGKPPMK